MPIANFGEPDPCMSIEEHFAADLPEEYERQQALTNTDWATDAPEAIGTALADKHLRVIEEAVTMTDDRLLTNDALAAIAARAEEVARHTPATWDRRSHDGVDCIIYWLSTTIGVGGFAILLRSHNRQWDGNHAVLDFTAHARADIPALLAHIRALASENAGSKLTDAELTAIREYITGWEPTRDRRFLEAARALLDHSDALASENARLRDALAAVCEEATRSGDPHNLIHQCAFCGKVSQYAKDPRTIVHEPDCPIAAARALLEGGA